MRKATRIALTRSVVRSKVFALRMYACNGCVCVCVYLVFVNECNVDVAICKCEILLVYRRDFF